MSRARCVIVLVYFGASPAFALETRYHASERAKLMEVYREAVMHDSELAAARADFEARRETIPQARANLLPTINSGATIESTRLVRDEPLLTRVRSGTTFQANLKQPLFNAESWFGLKAAEAATSQASLELSAKEQELILKSAETYFETLRASDERAASEAEEIALKQQMDQAQARLKGGLSSITDVLDAQAAFDNAQANRKFAERKVDDAFEQMVRLTNHGYESIEGIQHKLPILPPVPEDAKTWVDAALRQNLMLQASNHAVQAAEETLSQRQAGHAPTLDVVASYRKGDNDSFGYSNPTDFGRSGYQGNVSQSSIALQVNVPLYNGGRINSQTRESYKRLTQSEELRETQRRAVVFDTAIFTEL